MTGKASNLENNHIAVLSDDTELRLNSDTLHPENSVEGVFGRSVGGGNEPRQCVDDTRELEVTRLILTEEQWETYLTEARKPFDPFNDVLCRFWLIELPERKILAFDFCHLIMDSMSIALLFVKMVLLDLV